MVSTPRPENMSPPRTQSRASLSPVTPLDLPGAARRKDVESPPKVPPISQLSGKDSMKFGSIGSSTSSSSSRSEPPAPAPDSKSSIENAEIDEEGRTWIFDGQEMVVKGPDGTHWVEYEGEWLAKLDDGSCWRAQDSGEWDMILDPAERAAMVAQAHDDAKGEQPQSVSSRTKSPRRKKKKRPIFKALSSRAVHSLLRSNTYGESTSYNLDALFDRESDEEDVGTYGKASIVTLRELTPYRSEAEAFKSLILHSNPVVFMSEMERQIYYMASNILKVSLTGRRTQKDKIVYGLALTLKNLFRGPLAEFPGFDPVNVKANQSFETGWVAALREATCDENSRKAAVNNLKSRLAKLSSVIQEISSTKPITAADELLYFMSLTLRLVLVSSIRMVGV